MTTLTSWKKMVAGYLRVPGCRVQKINILSGWVMLWPHCDGIRRNDGNSKRGHPQGFFLNKTAGHHRTVLALVIIYLWIGFSKNWIIHRFSIDFPLIFLFMDRIFHRFSNSHGKKTIQLLDTPGFEVFGSSWDHLGTLGSWFFPSGRWDHSRPWCHQLLPPCQASICLRYC